MALTSRRLHREEEEESVFVSMTDLMISILFIVMIVMAFFAKSAREDIPRIETLEKQIEWLTNKNEELSAKILLLEGVEKENVDLSARLSAARKRIPTCFANWRI